MTASSPDPLPGIRVLQLMAGAPHGGAEAFFERLVPALARAGLRQQAAIRTDGPRAARLAAAGVDAVQLPFGGPLDWRTGPAVRRLARRFEPTLVLSWMSRATRFQPPGRHVRVARLGGYYGLKHYRACDHLVGNTPAIVAHIVAGGWPRERAHYLPNFVDAAPARPVDRAGLATPAGAPVLLALGRLHRNKAFDVLIEALPAVPDAVLWLAGAGPEEGALRGLAEARGVAARVRFLGWREDMPALCAAADLLVCPSRHEPLGNVVIEGWAHGLPVVAAASDGPRGLIEPSAAGLLVPMDDAAALAGAIGRALGDLGLRAALAAAGQAAYARDFTEQAVVARYLDFFRQVSA